MNLVIGATGLVGMEICRLLSAAGKPVRAFVRASSDRAKVEKLKAFRANIVIGDLRDVDGGGRELPALGRTAVLEWWNSGAKSSHSWGI